MKFVRRTGAAFAGSGLLALAIAGAAIWAAYVVIAAQDDVLFEDARELTMAEQLRFFAERESTTYRGYLISGDTSFLRREHEAEVAFDEQLRALRGAETTPTGRVLLGGIDRASRAHDAAMRDMVGTRTNPVSVQGLAETFDRAVMPTRIALEAAVHEFVADKQHRLDAGMRRVKAAGTRARWLTLGIATGGVTLLALLGLVMTRILAGMYREKQDAVRARDDFLAAASHELRTPLSAMLLQCGVLQKRLVAGEVVPARLTVGLTAIDRQIRRMSRLIADLLDTSRVMAGRLDLVLEEVDLAAITREVVERLRYDLEKAGCAIEVRASGAVRGCWDGSRLDQVVTNLVTNAMKYGTGKPIAVAVEQAPGQARVTIQDHGVGIPPEEQRAIFERFERATTARRFPGVGLGLWIAHQIVAAHGGRIAVDSSPGQGAKFSVTMPTSPPPAVATGHH